MKRNALNIVALIFFMLFVSTTLLTFEKQTGQDCGPPEKIVEHTYLFTEYSSTAEKNAGFIDCVGPSYFISYRPLDISIIGSTASVVALYLVKKRAY